MFHTVSRDFKETQRQFAAQIRDPDSSLISNDSIEPRRLKIYQDLFFKNIESFAANAFPVFRSLFDDEVWLDLVREFMVVHRAKTPYFLEISQEFMLFTQHYTGNIQLPNFTNELMHYEWLELALDVAEDDTDLATTEDIHGELANSLLLLSSLAVPLIYQYPVHQISRDYRPNEPASQPVCLLVFRDKHDKVRFSEINSAIYQLLVLIKDQPCLHLGDYVEILAGQLGYADVDSLLAFTLPLLEKFRTDDIILVAKHK